MSIVAGSLQLGGGTTAEITAAAAVVPLVRQVIVNRQTGQYYIGDGTTALGSLTAYGGASGLTVGTTTITSGTNTRILYNNAGVVGEYLVTGTGTTAVLSTSPTFTTDITTPLIIGGAGVGSVIQYKGTSGNGTSTVAAHQFLVGNNGATTAMSVYNSGQLSVGNYASPTNLRITTIGQDTAYISIGSLVGSTSYGAFYFNQATPSVSNYGIIGTTNETYLNTADISTGSSIGIRSSNSNLFVARGDSSSSSTIATFTFTNRTHTNQVTTVNSPSFRVNGSTKTWAAGALTTQYFNYFSANTVDFAGASTATDVYGLYVEKSVAGTNATITNSWALGANGGVNLTLGTASIILTNLATTTTNSALYMNVTPSTTNYTIRSNGSNTWLNTPGSSLILQTGATTKFTIESYKTTWSPTTYSGAGVGNLFELNPANGSALTTGQEISTFVIGSSSKQYNTGAMTNHRDNWFKTTTISYVGASVLTNYYGVYFEAATVGTNATITNNYAAGFSGNINIIGTPYVSGVAGVDGSFTTVDGKTVTVSKGIITAIV